MNREDQKHVLNKHLDRFLWNIDQVPNSHDMACEVRWYMESCPPETVTTYLRHWRTMLAFRYNSLRTYLIAKKHPSPEARIGVAEDMVDHLDAAISLWKEMNRKAFEGLLAEVIHNRLTGSE